MSSTAKTWSTYQETVFRFFAEGAGNGVVEAVAGSGKTTTLVEGLRRWRLANPTGRAIFVAFNKSIATELQAKVPAGVDASTLHSAGFRAVRTAFRNCRVDDKKLAGCAEAVAQGVTNDRETLRGIEGDLVRAYGLLKGTQTDLTDGNACEAQLATQGIELEYRLLSLPLLPKLDRVMTSDTTRCTFDEMLSFVVDHGLPMATYDLVCVDEAQDMNLLQIALLKKMLKPTGRLCAVGDSYQAIYAFRGADSQAMNRIRTEFAVPAHNEMPLSITYRCPRLVVAAAQAYVGHILPCDGAADGAIVHASDKELDQTITEMADGDMGICRCNAPLVACALKLIKKGRKAIVRGRDIGKGLAKLVRDLRYDGTVNGLLEAVTAWEQRETQRFAAAKKEAQAQATADRAETLIAIAVGADSVDEVMSRICNIFSDDKVGVVFSSIHKAKGLEADKVVWLNPGLTDFFAGKAREKGLEDAAKQEENLAYVAITRAKATLVYQPLPRKG